MDSELIKKEKELERAKLDNDIETQRAEIAQKKAVEREMKGKYGRDWKKILGVKPNKDSLHMYTVSNSLRDLSIPRRPQ